VRKKNWKWRNILYVIHRWTRVLILVPSTASSRLHAAILPHRNGRFQPYTVQINSHLNNSCWIRRLTNSRVNRSTAGSSATRAFFIRYIMSLRKSNLDFNRLRCTAIRYFRDRKGKGEKNRERKYGQATAEDQRRNRMFITLSVPSI